MEELLEKLKTSDKILLGIGTEWTGKTDQEKEAAHKAAALLWEFLKEKDFYVVTSLSGEALAAFPLPKERAAAPLEEEFSEESWKAYTDWLGRTLNKNLVILELGEGFSNPSVFRWPFEKIAALNNKASLYRVHKTFYQIPDELAGKAKGIKENSVEFVLELLGA